MSNIQLIIDERPADIGNFLVGRLLPFREKRAVGPFVFIDHLGPAALNENENLDVAPHPHIGLSTLTYLFEGSMMHRDSLGTEIEIQPGAVNWMTAGKGIVHSERTPDYLRKQVKHLHGLQIWVALPKEFEEIEPNFSHVESKSLPSWKEDGLDFKLIAGEIFGKKSPVPVYSPMYFLEIKSKEKQFVNISDQLFGECGMYILEGKILSEGHTFESKHILNAKESKLCSFEMDANTTVYIFGGIPFPEERFIFWNFVSSSKIRIEEAKQKWENQEFNFVPGEVDFVPLPKTFGK
jgi:redox-sensitive bicupin YhaK (pirin superfamily)